LANIEATVEHRVLQKLQSTQDEGDVPMSSTLEPRVAQLEQQIATLQSKSVIIENKVDHLHHQVETQTSKFESALDSKLSEQMARIEALMSKRARQNE
jgi:hypothetical protein